MPRAVESGAVIVFDDVWCARGSTVVLRGLSLSISAGETVALVGRSGAGKSTALKLINRMLEPERGRVLVDGRDTRAWDVTALRRQTGYMLQDVGLFPHMTVSRNVAVVPTLLHWDAERINRRSRELLDLVGLPADTFAPRRPDQLSGGQRQRVGVARALAADPPVILMDEPFGALDPVTRSELHDVIRRIQSVVSKTIVLVTHDMREAFGLADRVGVLHEGTLVACAPPSQLQGSNHPEVRALLDAQELTGSNRSEGR
jgi:osmoprotectant transport system ATP-binding protein